MSILMEAATAILIAIGGAFLFVGSFGLAKLPGTMRRLHAPTKATTLGIGALLIGSMVDVALIRETAGFRELLITLFLFLTAPVSANMIAKAHIFGDKDVQATLPDAPNGAGWATLTDGAAPEKSKA